MAQLTLQQIEQIAALEYDPGFILLLDALQAQIDDVAVRLDEAGADEESQLLALWRAMRQIFATLKRTPEEFGFQLSEKREIGEQNLGINQHFVPERTSLPPQVLATLKAEYDRRMKDKSSTIKKRDK